ncbi:MAG: extracellular solute-binding protein [Clostridia bacterium]|nr:extracellular solute-binding protein [Clostridia bacterium]
MKITRSLISIFLVLTMLFSFVACSGGSTSDVKDTTASNESKAPDSDTTVSGIEYEADGLPDSLNFGGAKVSILSPGHGMSLNDITVEELSSEVILDSIYNRELFVEDRLGVEIENYKPLDNDGEILKQIASGEDTHQIFVGETYDFSKYSLDGVLFDLWGVENLDLNKPWWSSLFIEEASIGDSLYVATGSITLSLLRNLMVVYYNKNLAENYCQNNDALGELGDLYSLVENGGWTLDKLHAFSSEVYEDVNGSTTRDEEDVYGLGVHYFSLDAIWSSFDLNILSTTDDGWFELEVNTDKLFNALEKTTDLLHNSGGVYLVDNMTQVSSTSGMFASGRYLFAIDYLYISESAALRNMADEYGVLPFPKLDENQKEYFSYAYDTYLSYAIPNTNPSPEIAGAVMEALASYSYRNTAPAYLDTALKGKYMNDPQSRRMVDIVVNNFKLDTAWIYIFTLGASYPADYRNNIYENKRTFASEHQTNSRAVNRSLIGNKIKYEANLKN